MTDLVQLETHTIKGGYRIQSGIIKEAENYTGVTITKLVNMFHPTP
jgi:hypothetical protein